MNNFTKAQYYNILTIQHKVELNGGMTKIKACNKSVFKFGHLKLSNSSSRYAQNYPASV